MRNVNYLVVILTDEESVVDIYEETQEKRTFNFSKDVNVSEQLCTAFSFLISQMMGSLIEDIVRNKDKKNEILRNIGPYITVKTEPGYR